jgi:hypothetical protein
MAVRFISEAIDSYRRGWSPPFRGEIYEYAANLDLQNGYAIKGNFDVARSKYLIAPFRSVRNPRKRQVVILKGVQLGGSLIVDLTVPYTIEHDPGDTLWLFQSDDIASQYMKERFLPLLRRTKSLEQWIGGRNAVQQYALLMPHMAVMMGGLNESNVQSLSKRYVYVDEAWLAKSNGLIRQARARTTAFPYTSKFIVVSQAGNEGEDLDLLWQESNMQEWQWLCPSCQKYQTFELSAKRDDGSWAGMRWETNDFTRPNGRWIYPEVSKTARLECFHCGHQVDDTPSNRMRLDDTHRYEPTNTRADETIDGFHIPQIASRDISFGKIVTAYLEAKTQQEEHGYLLPLVEFYQKVLAKAWNLNTAADFHRIAHEPYDVNSDWPEEHYRAMTIDCQANFLEFWYVVRAWSETGESRQLARGRCESWEQLGAIQKAWRVQNRRVFVDCGYEQTRVAEECVKHGGKVTVGGREFYACWVALKGARQEKFLHTDKKTGNKDQRIYSQLDDNSFLDPGLGKKFTPYKVPFHLWSNLHVKDILRRHRDGLARKFLSLPDAADPSDLRSYTAQMNSEIRVKERDDNGRLINIWKPIRKQNHYWDCEAMQIVTALILGVIGGSISQQPEAAAEPPSTPA